MPFTVREYQDMVRLLDHHPEWQAELRRLVLSDELLTLPAVVQDLAEAQQRTEARLEQLAEAQLRTEARLEQLAEAQQRTETRLEQLAEAQLRTETRLERLEATVQALTEAQQHTETRLERLEATVQALTEAQQHTEARLERLEATVQALTEAQQHTEARLERLEATVQALAEDVRQLTADVRELTSNVRDLTEGHKRMEERLGRMIGDLLELRYRQHAAGYFGRWLRQARAVDPVTLEEVLEAALPHEDVLDVLRLDLLISGRWRALPEAPEVWLAVEVATVLNEGDVARAWRRANLLRQAGYRAAPIVAGERITPDGQASARAQTVGVVRDGQADFNVEELAAWIS